MSFKGKSLLTLLLAAALLFSLPVIGASAAEPIPLTDLTLTVNRRGASSELEGIDDADIVVDLYLIAQAEEDTEGHGLTVMFTNVNPDSGVTAEQLSYENMPKTDSSESEAAEFWEGIRSAAATAILGGDSVKYEPAVHDEKADTAITGLSAGLYLIVARGAGDYAALDEYRELNDDGEVVTVAEGEAKRYVYLPQLVVLPGNDNGDTTGEWLSDFTVYMKPSEEDMFGNLTIEKTVVNWDDASPATFVFLIKAELKGKTVYHDYISITYPTETKKDIDGIIPVGATVTVEEVYSGSCYTGGVDSISNDGIVPPPTDENGDRLALVVTATNTYDKRITGGYGIENTFSQNENGGWEWYKDGVLQTGGSK